MRAVVQRVLSASVEVDGHTISEIGPGLLVLVGLHESDVESDADYIFVHFVILELDFEGPLQWSLQTREVCFGLFSGTPNFFIYTGAGRTSTVQVSVLTDRSHLNISQCRKVLNMRLFPNDKTGRPWDQNVMQKNFGVLLVSQFTLLGILKGNKPDFHVAMPPQKAKPFYDSLIDKFRKSYNPDAIKDGVFGAMMKVHLVNDGPVTMQLDSSHPSGSKNKDEALEEVEES